MSTFGSSHKHSRTRLFHIGTENMCYHFHGYVSVDMHDLAEMDRWLYHIFNAKSTRLRSYGVNVCASIKVMLHKTTPGRQGEMRRICHLLRPSPESIVLFSSTWRCKLDCLMAPTTPLLEKSTRNTRRYTKPSRRISINVQRAHLKMYATESFSRPLLIP